MALALGVSANAATYYVDYAEGNDLANGLSPYSAWKHSPGDPAAAAVAGSTALRAGDTVQFKGGVAYVLTSASGIALRWNGSADSPIVYDGNTAGEWGTGRARFTDNHGLDSATAFSSSATASHLVFRNLEIVSLAGAANLPPDTGKPAAPRFGGGIVINGQATNVMIESCHFEDLGYTFNQKPMAAASIAGAGIKFQNAEGVVIRNCTFSRVAIGVDMTGSTSLSLLTIADCTFGQAMVWSIHPPLDLSKDGISVTGCTETADGHFGRHQWNGYGRSPRTTVQSVTSGSPVILRATAIATPAPTYQWLKNGTPVPEATSETLILPSVSTSDAGVYTVVVSNDGGSTESHEMLLEVSSAVPTTIAPSFTLQPVDQTSEEGGTVSFAVAVSGTPEPQIRWYRDGVTNSSWTGSTLTLTNVTLSDAGTFVAVATNEAGTASSRGAALTVTPKPSADLPPPPSTTTPPPSSSTAPVFTLHPQSQSLAAGSVAKFTVAVSGTPEPQIRWYRNGTTFSTWTGSTLTLSYVTSNDVGKYVAVATNEAGTTTSQEATLTLTTTTATTPAFTLQPQSQTAAAKSTVTLTAAASGSPAPTYQWFKNGAAIGGATTASLTLTNVNNGSAGGYYVVATNAAGSAKSVTATLTIDTTTDGGGTGGGNNGGGNNGNGGGKRNTSELTSLASDSDGPRPESTSRLVNVSVRSRAGSDAGSLIVGFVVAGEGSKPILIRGVGPGLNAFGVAQPMADPTLSVHSGSSVVAANDDWSASADAGEISLTASDVGAFALNPASRDATILTSVPSGAYTAQLGDKGAAGEALVELYETHPTSARLTNLSVRTHMDAQTTPVIGFVVGGAQPVRVLVRAVGPGLSAFGVPQVLANPRLEVFQNSNRLQSNDDWGNTAELRAAFEQTGAFPLPAGSTDAAAIITAAPGAYTIHISDVLRSSGTVLVELYELP